MILKTLEYGHLPIATSDKWLLDDVVDHIEVSPDEYYEVRKTYNNELVAIKEQY